MQPAAESLPPLVPALCRAVRDAGGRLYLVGGPVRDLLLGSTPQDFDLEVYGLEADALRRVAAGFGRCKEVGRAFGVLKLAAGGMEIDLALPRRERKTAAGHKGFDIEPDPRMSPAEASRRRDFTINAMMLDPLTGELLDFHGGRRDLARGVLRHVSDAFAEDPLRPLRGMQFAARFRLALAPETARLCAALRAEAASLPPARIWHEWEKWLRSGAPSFGLRALRESQWLALYPELAALPGTPQPPRWHPEGDVWTHTLLCVDQGARIAGERGLAPQRRIALVAACLCHDLGKPPTTTADDGRIRSPGHAQAGVPLAQAWLAHIHAPKWLREITPPLVAEHLCHMHGPPTPRAVRRLAARLAPADIGLWEMLVEADASARHPAPASRPGLPWLELARAQQSEHRPPERLATGRMLIELGMRPGPAMGRLLKEAWEAQLEGAFGDEAGARAWLCRRLHKE